MTSISNGRKKSGLAWWSVAVWLCIWQLAAMAIGRNVLLASPVLVARTLFALAGTRTFYSAVLFSLTRIALGFSIACVLGLALAIGSYRHRFFEQLTEPAIRVIKSIPVASFIILVLVWVSSKNLSVIISLLIVLPVIYSNTLEGLRRTDEKLLEMARVFRVRPLQKVRYIYVPQTFGYFKSGCSIALGLAWKSGIAAEVIGMPLGSMGEQLYQSKVFLDTPQLMAWTVALVALSFAFEKLVMALLDLAQGRVER